MIVAGAVLFYITVILIGVDENVASSSTVDHLCQTRIWLVAIGLVYYLAQFLPKHGEYITSLNLLDALPNL